MRAVSLREGYPSPRTRNLVAEFCTRIVRRARPLALLLIVACFGTDPGPQQAGGCQDDACSDVPVMVTGGKTFTKLAAGRFHTCGLLANGEVWCWGLNSDGQLGASTPAAGIEASAVPVKVGGSMTFKDISGGDLHTCGIGTDDGVWCWGSNESLVLGVANVGETCGSGENAVPCSRTPVRAAGTTTFIQVAAGGSHTCAIDMSNTGRCWGVNAQGELGTAGYGQVRSDPTTVGGDVLLTRISSGQRFSCGLDDLGAAFCWGLANSGQLGTTSFQTCTAGGQTFQCSPNAIAANTAVRFTSIELGGAFACGLSTTGALACWGNNANGQLGNGTFTNNATVLAVQGTGTWQSFGVGEGHACGIKSGTAYCWGLNSTAQLGTGSKEYAASVPMPVSGTRTYTQIVAGADHTCALHSTGEHLSDDRQSSRGEHRAADSLQEAGADQRFDVGSHAAE